MNAGVVLLAGGEATRLPDKLALDTGGVPLVVRTFRAVAVDREIVVSAKGTFPPAIDAMLDAPLVVDRRPKRGPLSGLVSAMTRLKSQFAFAVAADSPLIDADFLAMLEREHRAGDEAVVPFVPYADGRERPEPLAALYDRFAFLPAACEELRTGRGSVIGVAAQAAHQRRSDRRDRTAA